MDTRTGYGLLTYIVVTTAFVCTILLDQRAYQDSWILQDILAPTVIYVIGFILMAVLITENKILALLCTSFVTVLGAVPSLKYHMIYGTADSVAHHGYAKSVLTLGYVTQTGFYGQIYSPFPGMHIFAASVSLVTGFQVNESIKLLMLVVSASLPLMTYLIACHIFDREVQRYIIMASGLPLLPAPFAVTGTVFAVPLFFSFLVVFHRRGLIKTRQHEQTLIAMIFLFALVFSHAVTTAFLMIVTGLLATVQLLFAPLRREKLHSAARHLSGRYAGMCLLLAVSFLARATFDGSFLTILVQDLLPTELFHLPVPPRFFEIPLQAQLQVLAVRYLRDAMVVLLSVLGVLAFARRLRYHEYTWSNLFRPLLCILGMVLLFLVFQMGTGYPKIEYNRLIAYGIVFSPFLIGLSLWRLHRSMTNSWKRLVLPLVLFLFISLSFVQVFTYQPLVPTATVLSQDLPGEAYIVDFRMVNTIYQERMISFADKFSGSKPMTADEVTRWQLNAFASEAFAARCLWYQLPEDKSVIAGHQSIIVLLHYEGPAGALGGKVEYRTDEAVYSLKSDYANVVYDNGESFVLSRD